MYLRDTSGDLVAFTLMLMLLLIFLAVKAAIFVTSTFLKYYKKWILWASLLVSILLCVSGGLLVAFVKETFVILIYAGISQLLIVCKCVDMVNRDTFMTDKQPLVERVLHSSWFDSDETPLEEQAA